MKIIKEHAIQEGTLLLLLCIWLTWYSLDGYAAAYNKDWTQSPYLFPLVMAVLLGCLGLVVGGQGIRRLMKAEQEKTAAAKDQGASVRVLVIIGLCLVYYAALALISMPYLACTVGGLTLRLSTFEVATLVFLLVLMLYMGVRKKPVLIFVPLGATIFLSVMFRSMLHVILP